LKKKSKEEGHGKQDPVGREAQQCDILHSYDTTIHTLQCQWVNFLVFKNIELWLQNIFPIQFLFSFCNFYYSKNSLFLSKEVIL
jgi:hypothetical protein